MVATQNIDTLGPIWTFSLRGVLTFVASGLDINGCVLSYFEGTANLHCYTSCTLTTLHHSKVSFLQCCCYRSRLTQRITSITDVFIEQQSIWRLTQMNPGDSDLESLKETDVGAQETIRWRGHRR